MNPSKPDPFIRSEDGSVRVRLGRRSGRLHVKRERRYAKASRRVIQTLVFGEIEPFLRWCDDDSLRFEHPMVASRIRSEGSALLEGR